MKRLTARLGWLRATATVCVLLSGSGAARAALPDAPAHEVEPSAEARHEFQLGVDMLQDPDGARYEEAFRQFMRAYALSPSWKILGNLGLSAFKLERFAEGIEAYERYLKAGGAELDATERQQIQRDLEFMKSSAGSLELTITGAEAGALSIQDTRQRAVGGPIINHYELGAVSSAKLRLMAGNHSLEVSVGSRHATLELALQSGESASRSVDLSAPAPAPAALPSPAPSVAQVGPSRAASGATSATPLRTVGLVVGGVGVAALVGGVVTLVIGSGKKSDLQKRCPNDTCSYSSSQEKQSFEDDKSSLKTLGVAGTALLVGGGVLAATGATFYVLGGPKSEGVALTAAPSTAGFALLARGSF